jgi:hypothetical protein
MPLTAFDGQGMHARMRSLPPLSLLPDDFVCVCVHVVRVCCVCVWGGGGWGGGVGGGGWVGVGGSQGLLTLHQCLFCGELLPLSRYSFFALQARDTDLPSLALNPKP